MRLATTPSGGIFPSPIPPFVHICQNNKDAIVAKFTFCCNINRPFLVLASNQEVDFLEHGSLFDFAYWPKIFMLWICVYEDLGYICNAWKVNICH